MSCFFGLTWHHTFTESLSDDDDVDVLATVQPWVMAETPKWRACMDFSATINADIWNHRFDLPRFLDCVQYIKPGSWVAVYDLTDAFWNVKVGLESRKYMGCVA